MNYDTNNIEVSKILVRLAENSRDAFWIRTADYTRQIYISPIFEQIWGRSIQSLYEDMDNWVSWLHPEDRIKLVASVAARNPKVEKNSQFVEHYRIVRPDGEIRWIKDYSIPIFHDDTLLCFAGIAQDITDDKEHEKNIAIQKERAEKASQVKSEFIRNMSHDLRTPLTGIIGMAELLERKTDDNENKRSIHEIKQATQELLNLFNQIIEIITLETGEISNKTSTFSLKQLIDGIIRMVTPRVKQKQLTLITDYDPHMPEFIIGHPVLIHRIVLNLLGNAIKFTAKGHVSIQLQVIKKEEHIILIAVKISDTGIGIAHDKLNVIFESFKRLQPAYEGLYEGSGLGLHIVLQLLKEIDGKITVESTPDQGSCFTCTIPLKLLSKDAPLPEKIGQQLEANNPHVENDVTITKTIPPLSGRILLVEDNLLVQKVTYANLTSWALQVNIASTGHEAVQLAQQQSYDLIFMDVGLPDIDGCTVTALIRQHDEHNKHVPIIALTAHNDQEVTAQCLRAGMNKVLTKPLLQENAQQIFNEFLHPCPDKPFIIDWELGLQLVNGNKALAQELMSMLIAELPNDKANMKAAYANGDMTSLKNMTHKLHGSLKYCAAPRLKVSIEQLETALKLNNEAIHQHFTTSCKEIDALLKTYHRQTSKIEQICNTRPNWQVD